MLLAAASPAPDYQDGANWMFRDSDVAGADVDLFYIHPTTARSEAPNQPPGDPAIDRWTDISVRERQVSAFDCCRRFVPRYRQATMGAMGKPPPERDAAFGLAYADVLSAFRSYLEHDNKGRPFVLAGHSQGARHALQLLREEIGGTPLERRLVAAYIPGIGIPIDALPVPACTSPSQTGCIVSWNSYDPDADVGPFIARSLASYGLGYAKGPILCVNPVSFSSARPNAPFAWSRGALPGPAVEGPLPTPQPKQVAARCDGGVLRVTTREELPVERLGGGNLHMADIALFWADIRANVRQRVQAFRRDK